MQGQLMWQCIIFHYQKCHVFFATIYMRNIQHSFCRIQIIVSYSNPFHMQSPYAKLVIKLSCLTNSQVLHNNVKSNLLESYKCHGNHAQRRLFFVTILQKKCQIHYLWTDFQLLKIKMWCNISIRTIYQIAVDVTFILCE